MTASALHQLVRQEDDAALLDQLLARLSVSARSKRNILSGWRLYIGWLRQEGGSLIHADSVQAQAFAAWLQRAYPAPATINNRLTQARQLYRVLITEQLCEGNPFEDVHGLVNPADLRRPHYLPEEVQRLLTHSKLEEQLLILLGAHAGLTGPEVVNLKYEDCGLNELQVGERTIQYSPELTQVMQAWRVHRGERPLLSRELSGQIFSLKDDHELRARVWRLCQQANVTYQGWYALRNAAGMRMLDLEGARATERQLGLRSGRAALHPTSRLVRQKRLEQG